MAGCRDDGARPKIVGDPVREAGRFPPRLSCTHLAV